LQAHVGGPHAPVSNSPEPRETFASCPTPRFFPRIGTIDPVGLPFGRRGCAGALLLSHGTPPGPSGPGR
jgi:hypothetical protein